MKKQTNRGFTLAEVLVALGLIAVAVVCFTPFMLISLKNVDLAGEQRKEMYTEKGEIEDKMSSAYNSGDDEIEVVFQRNGATVGVGKVKGDYLYSSQKSLSAYVAKENGSLSISPGTISETYKDKTQIEIFSDVVEFEDESFFKLYDKRYIGSTSASVIASSEIKSGFQFKIDTSDSKKAVLILNSNLLTMSGSPYTIAYSGMSAKLYVLPASMIVVGNYGSYYQYIGEGKWQKGAGTGVGKLGSSNLKDAIWTGSQYVTAGENGSWYYTENDGWKNKKLEVSNWLGKTTFHIIDLHFSEIFSQAPVFAAGYEDRGIYSSYLQAMKDPASVSVNVLNNGEVGKLITDGYFNDTPVYMSAYNYAGETYYSYSGSAYFDKISSDNITALASNGQKFQQSLFYTFVDGTLYKLRPSYDDVWKYGDRDIDGNYQEVNTTAYYYVIREYNRINNLDKDAYLVTTTRFPMYELKDNKYTQITNISGKKATHIEINGVKYKLTNGPGNDDTGDKMQEIKGNFITGDSISGSVLKTEMINSIVYAEDIWVACGKGLGSIDVNSGTTAISVEKSTMYKWNGQWNSNANSSTIIINTSEIVSKGTNKIIYRENGRWKGANLPSNVANDSALKLNKVEYIGGKFYAVGDKGTILSISLAELKRGGTWKLETGVATDVSLTGIAGWGEN